MNGERRDALLDEIKDLRLRAEAREFVRMEPDEQQLMLFLSIHEMRGSWKAHIPSFLYTTAAVAGSMVATAFGWRPLP